MRSMFKQLRADSRLRSDAVIDPSANAIAADTDGRKRVSGLISSRLSNDPSISTMPTHTHRRLSVAACVWSKRHTTVAPTGRQPSVRLQHLFERMQEAIDEQEDM